VVVFVYDLFIRYLFDAVFVLLLLTQTFVGVDVCCSTVVMQLIPCC